MNNQIIKNNKYENAMDIEPGLHKKSNTPSVVYVSGNFNVLHPGHIRLLKYARKLGDILIVGVFSDKLSNFENKNNQEQRYDSLNAIGFLDQVTIIQNSLREEILSVKPNIIVKGREFENCYNEEEEYLKPHGGRLLFHSGEMSDDEKIKTLRTKPNFLNSMPSLKNYMNRRNIDKNNLLTIINNFSNLKICVVGETIIDEYIDCFPLGMSQEEPIVAFKPVRTENYIGGAGIVSSHASRMGSQVSLFSLSGDDKNKELAGKFLTENNVKYQFIVDKNRPTPLKQRFRSNGSAQFKISNLSEEPIDVSNQNILIENINSKIQGFDALIFSDFNYGLLPNRVVTSIIKRAKEVGVFVAADSQSSSQIGDISRFSGVDLITPTEREARLALQNKEDGLVIIADKLMKKTKCPNIILKLGENGLIAQNKDKNTDTINALNENPVDVSGAGDSLLSTSALAMCAGASLWEASLLGAMAAAIQVNRLGNSPITQEELMEACNL